MKTEETTQAGGEKALVEQIATLQKQLDDCLETKPLVKDEVFHQRMINTVASIFMPISLFNDHRKNYENHTTHGIWWRLRSRLLIDDECKHLFDSKDFREVMSEMNSCVDNLAKDPDTITFSMLVSGAESLLDDTSPKGWELVMDGLRIIETYNEDEQSYIFSPEDLQDLWVTLQTIHRCVKMFHEAVEPAESGQQDN